MYSRKILGYDLSDSLEFKGCLTSERSKRQYTKQSVPKVANISKITDAIQEFTQLPLNIIKNDLKWGEGPILEIVQLDDYLGCSTCDDDTVGYFDEEQPSRIFLDKDYVNQIETGDVVETDDDAFIFFLGTTILHEYVHYGENRNPDFFYWGEEGVKFEIKVYNTNVTPNNARLVLKRN